MQLSVCLLLVSMAVVMPTEALTVEQLIALLEQIGVSPTPPPAQPVVPPPVEPVPQVPAEPVVPVPVEPVVPATTEATAISAIDSFAAMGAGILTQLNAELSTLTTQAMTQISLKPALDIFEDIVPDIEGYFDELSESALKLAEELPITATPAAVSKRQMASASETESLATSILNGLSTTAAETLVNLQAELANLRIQAATQTELADAVDVLEDTVSEVEEFQTELTESITKFNTALPATVDTVATVGDTTTVVTTDQSSGADLLTNLLEIGQDFADTMQSEQARLTNEASAAESEAELVKEQADQATNDADKDALEARAEALEMKADQLSKSADIVGDILSDYEDLQENLQEWIPQLTAALEATGTATAVRKRTLEGFLTRLLAIPRSVQ